MTYHKEIRVITKTRKPRLKQRFVKALQHTEWQTVNDIAVASNNKVGRVRMWLRMLNNSNLLEIRHVRAMYGIDQALYRLYSGVNSDQCMKVLL